MGEVSLAVLTGISASRAFICPVSSLSLFVVVCLCLSRPWCVSHVSCVSRVSRVTEEHPRWEKRPGVDLVERSQAREEDANAKLAQRQRLMLLPSGSVSLDVLML